MEFVVNEADIAKLLMGYLKDRGAYESLSSFLLETGLCDGNCGDELLVLQRLVLQGRWDEVDSFIQPLKDKFGVSSEVDFLILRQKFLEALSYQDNGGSRLAFPPWRPAGGGQRSAAEEDAEKEELLNHLLAMRPLCSEDDFAALLNCLTNPNPAMHGQYEHWTVSQGRLECFAALRNMLYKLLPGENDPTPVSTTSNGLLKTIAMSTAYQTSNSAVIHNKAAFNPKLGYIVPQSYNAHSHVPTPSITIAQPMQLLRRFDTIIGGVTHSYPSHLTQPSSSTMAPCTQQSPRGSYQQQQQQQYPVVQDPILASLNSTRNSFSSSMTAGQQAQPSPRVSMAGVADNVFNFSSGRLASDQQPPPGIASSFDRGQYEHRDASNSAIPAVPKRAPVAWVAGDTIVKEVLKAEEQAKAEAEAAHRELIAKAALIISDATPPAKPMPPALRRKMELQQQQQQSRGSGSDEEGTKPPATQQQQQRQPLDRPSSSHGRDVQRQPSPVYDDEQQDSREGGPPPVRAGESNKHRPQSVAQQKLEDDDDTNSNGHRPQSKQTANQGREVGRGAEASPDRRDMHKEDTTGNYAYERPVTDPCEEYHKQQQQQEVVPVERPRSHKQGPSGSSSSSVQSGSTASRATHSNIPVPVPSKAPPTQKGVSPPPAVLTTAQSDSGAFSAPPVNVNVNVVRTGASQGAASVVSGGDKSGSSRQKAQAAPSPMRPPPLRKYLLRELHLPTDAPCVIRCVNVVLSLNGGSGSSPRGSDSRIVIGTNDRTLHFLKYDRSKMVKEFQGAPPSVLCEAQGFVTNTLDVVNVHKGSVYAMDIHNNKRIIVSGSNDKFLKISSFDANAPLETLRGHTGTIRVVRFQPYKVLRVGEAENSNPAVLIASAGGDKVPRIWEFDPSSGRGGLIYALQPHSSAIHGLVWISPTIVMTGDESGVVMLQNIHNHGGDGDGDGNGDYVKEYNLTNIVHAREKQKGIRQSEDDINMKRGICCLTLLAGGTALNGEQEGNSPRHNTPIPVIGGCESGFVTIFDAYSGRMLGNHKLHDGDIRSVFMSPAGDTLLTASYDGTAALWTVRFNNTISEFDIIPKTMLAEGHVDKVLCAAMVGQNGDVVTTGADGRVVLWTV